MSLIDVNAAAVTSQPATQQEASSWLDGLTRGLGSLTQAAATIYQTRAQLEMVKQQNRFGYSAYEMNSMLGQIPVNQNIAAIGPDGKPVFYASGAAPTNQTGKLLMIGALALAAFLLLRR